MWLPTPHNSKTPLPTHSYKKLIGIDTQICDTAKGFSAGLPYKNSVATVCFNGTIWEKIDAVANAGFDLIEIMDTDLNEAPAAKIHSYCVAKNLTILILQPFRDLEGYPENIFEEKIKRFEEFLKVCKVLHTDTVLLCANCDPGSSNDENLIVSQLRKCAQLAAKYNIKIAYENLSWAAHLYKFENLCEIILKVDEPNFGVCVDTFHINIHNSSLDPIDKLHGKVFFVQFCDSPILRDIGIIEQARNYRVFPFQGDYTNNLQILDKVKHAGYTGHISLEVFNRLFKERTGQCELVASDALRSLVYLQAVYSDQNDGTSHLPDFSVSAISGPQKCHDLSDLTFGFASNNDIKSFRLRCQRLGYKNYGSFIQIKTGICPGLALVEVPSRLQYNRYTLFLRTVLQMEPIYEHKNTKTNEINLPVQTCFGNRDELVLVTLKVMAE